MFLRAGAIPALRATVSGGITEFEALLLRTTVAAVLIDAGPAGGLRTLVEQAPRVERYNEVVGIFGALEQAAALPGPKLVFAHIRIPHDPYVFGKEGQYLPDQTAHAPGYPDQVTYLNDRLLPIVDRILQQAGPSPVILLQGDHGSPEFRADARRMSILNATRLPAAQPGDVYPTLSPVNSFRLVFDRLFDTQLGRLPDVSYLSLPGSDLQFAIVPPMTGCVG